MAGRVPDGGRGWWSLGFSRSGSNSNGQLFVAGKASYLAMAGSVLHNPLFFLLRVHGMQLGLQCNLSFLQASHDPTMLPELSGSHWSPGQGNEGVPAEQLGQEGLAFSEKSD